MASHKDDMMIRDIAIHFTGSDEDRVRIAYAAQLGSMFDAHLTGLLESTIPEPPTGITTAVGAELAQAAVEGERKRAIETAARLDRELDATGLAHEVRRVETYAGYLAEAVARQVRTSDLFVATRPYGDPQRRGNIEETALFSSGRPCFLVPPKGTPPAAYDTIFVAWKETREAARAVAEALPLLAKARTVVVAIVEEQGASERFREEAGADIGRYLSRHGVRPEIRKINGWDYASAALDNEIGAVRPDLVVMGGYGHSKLREWILGGATRDILSSSAIPVLMAH